MKREEIFNKVAEILNETFEIPLEEIKGDSLIQDDLDLDSIDAVDLIVKLQKYTSKNIDPAEFKLVKTVDDVVTAIEKLFVEEKL
ncbi:MAG: acyl carrier protein [Spirochaetales bacterium]|nr:acyl carrier protein [Spirochaetales bacterium]